MAGKGDDEDSLTACGEQSADADGGKWGGRGQEVEGGELDEFDQDAARPSRNRPGLKSYIGVERAEAHASEITQAEQNEFLLRFAETGQWNQSAYAIGRSGRAFRALAQREPGFCVLVQEALQDWREAITGEIVRRGFVGVLKPVFGSGGKDVGNVQVGVERVYSDRLLELEAKAINPEKYREVHGGGAPVDDRNADDYGVVEVPAKMVDPKEWERVYGAQAAGRLARKVTRPVNGSGPPKG